MCALRKQNSLHLSVRVAQRGRDLGRTTPLQWHKIYREKNSDNDAAIAVPAHIFEVATSYSQRVLIPISSMLNLTPFRNETHSDGSPIGNNAACLDWDSQTITVLRTYISPFRCVAAEPILF